MRGQSFGKSNNCFNSSFFLPGPTMKVGRLSVLASLDIGLGPVNCFGQFSVSRGDVAEALHVLTWGA